MKDNHDFTPVDGVDKIPLNRYIKILGHDNWFLVFEPWHNHGSSLSEVMREKLRRVCMGGAHNKHNPSIFDRIGMAAAITIDYDKAARNMGPLLIREIGSYMPMGDAVIIDEALSNHFPIQSAEVVICENDQKPEYGWMEYLKKRFPNKSISTINFFDLRTDEEISSYFKEAKYITFSTTFSKWDWFEKLTMHSTLSHKIIGYSHDNEKWDIAKKINPLVEIVRSLNPKS